MNCILTADLDDEMNRRSRGAEYEASQSTKYSISRDKLFETVGRESWILPEEFTLKIELLEKTLKARHESYFDSLDSAAFECRKVAQGLRDVARRDMASQFNPLMSWVRNRSPHRTNR